ncbi:MAG: septation regulator SpoVG [Ruminococcaceae bacterium]|nr:septation regulator SpoVG [Oscillospiraceae bacterium]
MTITNVKIRRLMESGKLRAIVSVTFDDELAVHDIKVIEGQERLFLAMPARTLPNGDFADIAHPTSSELRRKIETAVIEEYLRVKSET